MPWDISDRATAGALRLALLEVVLRLSEMATQERAKAAERQQLLVAELHHRVKNILALISALVARTHEKNETLGSFVAGLEGRIKALAFAHDQAVHTGSGNIVRLFEAETAPFRQDGVSRVVLEGPRVALDAHAYSVVALVIHEMATSAAKHGALSVPPGRVAVQWEMDWAGNCVIKWSESGGPAVQAATGSGFGHTLIERQIPHELNGETEVKYELAGLKARFVIPSKHIYETGENDEGSLHRAIRTSAAAKSEDCIPAVNYLFVEDNFLIALDGQALLLEAGAKSVEVVSSAEAALTFISHTSCDAAVLDINLGRGTSMPVADELIKRNVPFVFATG